MDPLRSPKLDPADPGSPECPSEMGDPDPRCPPEVGDPVPRCPSEVGDPESRGKKGLRVASHELVP